MALTHQVPGVYFEPRPRTPPPPVVRTDVAGFIGFEPRVRDGSTPSQLTGGPPPTAHSFQVDVAEFELTINGSPEKVAGVTDLVLSSDPAATLVNDGQSVVFAIAAAKADQEISLIVTAGIAVPTPSFPPAAPPDAAVEARVQASLTDPIGWTRIADVEIRRQGDRVHLIVRPALPAVRCDDWRDFLLRFGEPIDDGAFLAPAVRAFFANGGSRCWVAAVSRPGFDDAGGLQRVRTEMLGVQGAPKNQATGLEQLLLIDEVMIVDVPDLYARRVVVDEETVTLPPSELDTCFRDCDMLRRDPVEAEARGQRQALEPVYDENQVFDSQRLMLERAAPHRWRLLLLFSPPLTFDAAEGRFRGPSVEDAKQWRDKFASVGLDENEISCGALYFPWLLSQERIDAPVMEMPPSAFAAGVIARRDLQRGPHVSPANETLRGVVGLTRQVNDGAHGDLYETPRSVNVIRPFPGYGIQVWGARTLSEERFMRYLAVRRCLSAIERKVSKALEPVVFEPNTQILWLRVTQLVFGILLPVFESGALRGSRPDQAFFVRCDASNNPPEAVEQGLLLCEVGVAIAAPAEFIVFRVGRREGVVEVIE